MPPTNLENEVSIRWIVEGHILFLDVSVEATNHMATYDQIIVDHLDTAADTVQVDLIIRLASTRSTPPSLKRLTSYKYQQHPRLGYVVMIGLNVNPVIRFIIASATKIANMKMRTFETLEQAEYFLRTMRQI